MPQRKRLHHLHLDVELFPCWRINVNVQNKTKTESDADTEIVDQCDQSDLSCPGYPPCEACPTFLAEDVPDITPTNMTISPCPLCWPPNTHLLSLSDFDK